MDTGCLHNLTINDTVTDFTYTPDEERSFLLDLFYATGGPYRWINATGWRDNNNTDHCHWYGVECYENGSFVKSINLNGNNLVGQPPNFWRFRNLQGLCLSGNKQMSGQISDVVSSDMIRLRVLCVSYNRMQGRIPWSLILQLSDLEKLQICCMNPGLVSDELPYDIDTLTKLQVLSVGENDIKYVDLPRSIGNLNTLWFLDLEYITLRTGDLSYFNKLSQLKYLHLTNCGMKGTIPENFGQTHPNMVELRLYGNNLEGELRSCFHGFQKIIQLSLGANTHLHGLIPTALSELKTLEVLDLSLNNFTGFAENMTFNKQLQTIYIGQNINLNVEGNTFLQALQNCRKNLRMLDAKNCGLKGGMSNLLWNFPKILYIDLSENNMTGQVPTNPGFTMANLFYLTLANNNFTGELPKFFFSPLKTLTYLDIRGNKYMKSSLASLFEDYLKVTFSETLEKDKLTCPTLRLTNSGGKADIDPDYYGYALCFCNAGYYGFRQYCQPCMNGASCQVKAGVLTAQKETKKTRGEEEIEVEMIIQKGYWPCCGNFTNVTRMVKCSQEEQFDDEICSPSGKCKCQLKRVNGQLLTYCNTSCICRYGNKGRFCSQCIDGYYKKGSLCISCPEFRKNFPIVLTVCFVLSFLISVVLLICYRKYRKRLLLILMFALAVTMVVLHFKSVIPGWFFVIIFAVWILGLSDTSENGLEGFLCIAVFFFQSLDAMFSDANIWPRTILLLKYQITNAFNFEISELTCSFSDANQPEVSFAIILSLPLAGITLIWLSYGFLKLLKTVCYPNLNIDSSTCKRLTIQILLFLYFPITAKTFQAVLPCEHRDGLSYLKETPWLDCDGRSYNWLLGLGYSSLAVFVIGLPLVVFAPLLFKYANNDEQDENMWLKPLYQEFKSPYRRFFPLVFLFRRLLVAVFLTVVPTSSSYQVIGITLLLVVFIAIILIYRPYEKYWEIFEFENMADVVVSVILLLSFVGLALLRVSRTLNSSLVWLIISMNCIVVFCCILSILVLFFVKLWKSSERNDYEQIQGGQRNDNA